MDESLINNINDCVKPNDILFHLGDWCMRRKDINLDIIDTAAMYREKIKCKNIINIIGNHDPQNKKGEPNKKFSDIFNQCASLIKQSFDVICPLSKRNVHIIMCHYAMRVWESSHHGTYHAFGHSHFTLDEDLKSLSCDVGVDAVAGRATGMTYGEMKKKDAWSELKPEHYRPMSINEIVNIMSKRTPSFLQSVE